MVVNVIIDRICRGGLGFRNERFYIPALFYADDGLLIANGRRDLERMVDTLRGVSREVGLEMNEKKCLLMILNSKEQHQEMIGEIEVVRSIKYLGIDIDDGRRYYAQHKKGKIEQARRMSLVTYSVIARCCNKLLIGKTFWKSVVLPSVLHGSAVVIWNKTELGKLQTIENAVWRQILGAPSYAPVSTLQGEIGTSTAVARDMKVKLLYYKHLMKSGNELLREIVNEESSKENPIQFINEVRKYAEEIGANGREICRMSVQQVRSSINEWAHDKWRADLASKSTLQLYRDHKHQIAEEKMYDNRYRSVLLYRCRTNTLKLGWRNRFTGGEVMCGLCREEVETLEHFIKKCGRLQGVRVRHQIEETTPLHNILLFGAMSDDCVRRFGTFVEDLWQTRGGIMKIEQLRVILWEDGCNQC
jgi:hypothetical protein